MVSKLARAAIYIITQYTLFIENHLKQTLVMRYRYLKAWRFTFAGLEESRTISCNFSTR